MLRLKANVRFRTEFHQRKVGLVKAGEPGVTALLCYEFRRSSASSSTQASPISCGFLNVHADA
jgi:hypothetical protein